MSDEKTDLKLDLPLDGVEDGRKLPDESGDGLDGTLQGSARIIPDDTFGATVELDGVTGYASVPNSNLIDFAANQDFTVELWVKADPSQRSSQQPYTSIVEKWNGATGFPYAIRYLWDSKQVSAGRYDQTPATATVKSTSTVAGPEHRHVAFVKRGADLLLYIDGTQEATARDGTTGTTTNTAPLTLGAMVDETGAAKNFFKGQLSHLRIYNRALAADEIREDIQVDLTSIAAYTRSHPLEFSLYNGAGLAVLVAKQDPTGLRLTLEVMNTSGQDMKLLAPSSNTPSADNHHFALWLRPGTLSDASLSRMTVATPGWVMTRPETQPGGVVVIYLLATAAHDLPAAERLSVTLNDVSGAPGGSRETRVELSYQRLAYAGQEQTPITGTHLSLLAVVNAVDVGSPPFEASLVTGNRILNDGKTANSLRLRLTNVSSFDVLTLEPEGSPEPSRIILSFDAAPNDAPANAPWALGTVNEVEAITATYGGQNLLKSVQGSEPTWTLTPKAGISLRTGQSIEIALSTIVSSLPSGQTNLYVDYENIPNHGNGGVVALIEKGPVVVAGTEVGIGTAAPATSLQILGAPSDANGGALMLGAANSTNLRLGYDAAYGWIQAHAKPLALNPAGGAVGIGVTAPAVQLALGDAGTGLQQQGAGQLGVFAGGTERLRINASGQVGIGTPAPTLSLSIVDAGTGVHRPETNVLALYTNGKARLTIDPTGHIGVGVSKPLLSLSIVNATTGIAAVADGTLDFQINGQSRLLLSAKGNVGLGVANPGEKLDVGGNVRAQQVKLGSWVIRTDGDDLVFERGDKRIKFKSSGTIDDSGSSFVRDGDEVQVIQKNSGAFINGTTSGDNSHPSEFHQWTYWRKKADDDSKLKIKKL